MEENKEKLSYLRNVTCIFLVKILTAWFIPMWSEKYYAPQSKITLHMYTETHSRVCNEEKNSKFCSSTFFWIWVFWAHLLLAILSASAQNKERPRSFSFLPHVVKKQNKHLFRFCCLKERVVFTPPNSSTLHGSSGNKRSQNRSHFPGVQTIR